MIKIVKNSKYSTAEEFLESNHSMFDTDAKKALFLGGRYLRMVMNEMSEYYRRTGERNFFEEGIWRLLEDNFSYKLWLKIMNLCTTNLALCKNYMIDINNYEEFYFKDFTPEVKRFQLIKDLGIEVFTLMGNSDYPDNEDNCLSPEQAKQLFFIGIQANIEEEEIETDEMW